MGSVSPELLGMYTFKVHTFSEKSWAHQLQIQSWYEAQTDPAYRLHKQLPWLQWVCTWHDIHSIWWCLFLLYIHIFLFATGLQKMWSEFQSSDIAVTIHSFTHWDPHGSTVHKKLCSYLPSPSSEVSACFFCEFLANHSYMHRSCLTIAYSCTGGSPCTPCDVAKKALRNSWG